MGGACQRALELVAKACEQAPPDAEELGGWLLDHALGTRGWPDVKLTAFASALGAGGLASVRERVEQLWTELPVDRGDGATWMREHGLRRLREELAGIDGDVDARIAVLAEQLPRADISHRIARVLWQADRVDEALRHALQGLDQGPGWRVEPLADFLVEAYLQLDRGTDALALRWRRFESAPSRQTYRGLHEVATRLGQWPQRRDAALRTFRAAAATAPGVADELVHTLLDESDVDGAWQVVHEHDCFASTRMAAARRRAETHPADAVPAYREAVEQRIEHKKASDYRGAAQLLRDLRELHARADTAAEFQRYLDDLRDRHRRKTRLLIELDRAGLR